MFLRTFLMIGVKLTYRYNSKKIRLTQTTREEPWCKKPSISLVKVLSLGQEKKKKNSNLPHPFFSKLKLFDWNFKWTCLVVFLVTYFWKTILNILFITPVVSWLSNSYSSNSWRIFSYLVASSQWLWKKRTKLWFYFDKHLLNTCSCLSYLYTR